MHHAHFAARGDDAHLEHLPVRAAFGQRIREEARIGRRCEFGERDRAVGRQCVRIEHQPARALEHAISNTKTAAALRSIRLLFTWFADFYGLFEARRRVQIPDQDQWLCSNPLTIR
jgi:hypothetical protein